MESFEPLCVFARRKSATVPRVWLSRRPELLVGVVMNSSFSGLERGFGFGAEGLLQFRGVNAFEPGFDLLLVGRQAGEGIAVMDGDDAAFDVRARGGDEREAGDCRQKKDDEAPKPAGGGEQEGGSAGGGRSSGAEGTLPGRFGEKRIKRGTCGRAPDTLDRWPGRQLPG